MAREIFKNLPDTSTPLSASKLNGIFNGEESMGSIVVEDITCRNMFNKHKALIGQELNGDDGTTTSNSNVFVSDYIKVNPNETYFISGKTSGQSNCFYDKDKNFISTIKIANGTITIPNNENICYVRFNGPLTEINTTQFEIGKVASNYIEPKEFSNKQIYSTEEQLIGTWLGKPLYRKVIYIPSLPNGTSTEYSHGISNIERITNIFGTAYSNTYDMFLTLPFVDTVSNSSNIRITANKTHINVKTGNDRSDCDASVTLEYTKTTD